MKTRFCFRIIAFALTGLALYSQVMSTQAETLPLSIDLAQASGTEGTQFTRTYPGAGDGIGSGNQAIAVADFNGDGFDDMAIGYANYAPRLSRALRAGAS
jgi:FG-GAP repeat